MSYIKIKKIISCFLILIILVSFFGLTPTKKVLADSATDPGTCTYLDATGTKVESTDPNSTRGECQTNGGQFQASSSTNSGGTTVPGTCIYYDSTGTTIESTDTNSNSQECQSNGGFFTASSSTSTASTTTNNSAFKNLINSNDYACLSIANGSFEGCFVHLVYFLLMLIPSFILWLSAYFFNVFVAIGLTSKLFAGSVFIPKAWAVVRDLSNIFFILILLYVAVKLILGIGAHDTKKMIARVLIMALLINFSMFFTEVVIDTSNILALIFYNKINVGKLDANGNVVATTPYENVTGEKDVAGGLSGSFNPANQLTPAFFTSARSISMPGRPSNTSPKIDIGIILGIMLLSGSVMLVAAYAFFVSGFSFLGRLIELFILIIFSPFAFMSFSVPGLDKVESIGWHDWSKKLITASFMAPIFMFFLYFIFMIVGAGLFDSLLQTARNGNPSFLLRVMGIFLPAMLIIVLLLKATDYAKKGSGKFGEMVMKGAQIAGGLAIGAASGGTALALRGTAGAFMKGASTGDTAANRMQGSTARIRAHQAVLSNQNSTIVEKTQAKKEIRRERMDQFKGTIQRRWGIQAVQNAIGARLNQDQHNVEHSAHARHDLDTAASAVAPGKKWDELNGEQRRLTRTNMERDLERRNNGWGNRTWAQLSQGEQAQINAVVNPRVASNTTHADQTLIPASRTKQGAVSSIMQSAVTGTYDVRKLADLVAREQTTGFAKFSTGLTGALASGMRGGLKMAGVNYGKVEGKFLKDLGSTISESLKNIKINVDLSHVGEQKKEDSHGGGHH